MNLGALRESVNSVRVLRLDRECCVHGTSVIQKFDGANFQSRLAGEFVYTRVYARVAGIYVAIIRSKNMRSESSAR